MAITNIYKGDVERSDIQKIYKGTTLLYEKLSTPIATASGTTISWSAVENATSYEIFVGGSSFGTVSTTSVDLSTLSGWDSLTDGEYSVTIVAKADGYADSEPSAAVSVTKAAEEDALAGTWVFNDTIDASGNLWFYLYFTCDGKQGNGINTDEGWLNYSGIATPVYTESGWKDEVYKTITITSKLSEVTGEEGILAWLQSNATKQ